MEVISTEDYLNRLTECNRRLGQEWTEGEELVHIGADVKALFPSLSAQRSGRIVREVVLESDLKFEGVDYRAAAMLVMYGMDLFEIRRLGLENIITRRRFHMGQRPGVTSKEALGGDGEREHDTEVGHCPEGRHGLHQPRPQVRDGAGGGLSGE